MGISNSQRKMLDTGSHLGVGAHGRIRRGLGLTLIPNLDQFQACCACKPCSPHEHTLPLGDDWFSGA